MGRSVVLLAVGRVVKFIALRRHGDYKTQRFGSIIKSWLWSSLFSMKGPPEMFRVSCQTERT